MAINELHRLPTVEKLKRIGFTSDRRPVLRAFFAGIDSLALYGGVRAVHFGCYCMLAKKRFSYTIYFKVLDGHKQPFSRIRL
ncbi:hypothetical protein ACH50O_00695 [Methylomonas sp. 2BW1-5-20]|uniref:hypothetical protein n=1 Tax=Methylomonas sp. 2BW1-5-20 TaxID=3376686 RepID=UPI004051A45A